MRRTRAALRTALLALVTERGYDKVTVQDVLDRADVGRSTFYAHFRDKDALFDSCFDDLRTDLERELGAATGPPVAALVAIFRHVDRNRRIHQAVGVAHVRRMLHDALRGHMAGAPMRLPAEIVVEFHTSALIGVLDWWVRSGFPHGPDEMARICLDLINPGLAAVEHP